MFHDVYTFVEKCPDCRRYRPYPTQRRLLQQLFSAEDALEFMVLNILDPLPKTKSGNCFVVITTDHFYKLTRAIFTEKAKVAHVAETFLDALATPDTISERLLSDN